MQKCIQYIFWLILVFPALGQITQVPAPGGGPGGATSVTLTGTANQITISGTSGACTTTCSWTFSFPAGGITFPSKVTFPAASSGGSSFNLPNGTAPSSPSAGDVWMESGVIKYYDGTAIRSFVASDTTHSSALVLSGVTSGAAAIVVNDVAGTAIAYILPTANGAANQILVDTGSATCPNLASGAPTTCHQLAWLSKTGTGSFMGATSPTNVTFDVEGTGNSFTATSYFYVPAATGSAALPNLNWNVLSSLAPTPVCSPGSTETTMLRCEADFPDLDGDYALQIDWILPFDFSGTVDMRFVWKAAATSGDVKWQAATKCMAAGSVEDAVFNTASTVTSTAAGTTLQETQAVITGLDITGCSANSHMHLKVFRNRTATGDSISGVVGLVGVGTTYRRTM